MLRGDELIPIPTPRVGRLDSSQAVRRELVKIYREARIGTLASTEATRLAYILQVIGKMLEQEDLEKRIEALEHAMETIGGQEQRRVS